MEVVVCFQSTADGRLEPHKNCMQCNWGLAPHWIPGTKSTRMGGTQRANQRITNGGLKHEGIIYEE